MTHFSFHIWPNQQMWVFFLNFFYEKQVEIVQNSLCFTSCGCILWGLELLWCLLAAVCCLLALRSPWFRGPRRFASSLFFLHNDAHCPLFLSSDTCRMQAVVPCLWLLILPKLGGNAANTRLRCELTLQDVWSPNWHFKIDVHFLISSSLAHFILGCFCNQGQGRRNRSEHARSPKAWDI